MSNIEIADMCCRGVYQALWLVRLTQANNFASAKHSKSTSIKNYIIILLLILCFHSFRFLRSSKMGIMQFLKKYPSRIVSSYFKSHLSKYEHERTSIRVTAPISLRNLLSAPLTEAFDLTPAYFGGYSNLSTLRKKLPGFKR